MMRALNILPLINPVTSSFFQTQKKKVFSERAVLKDKYAIDRLLSAYVEVGKVGTYFNTLWTGDADLRLYVTTVQDG